MSADDEGSDPILDALSEQVDGLVTGYVVLAAFLRADGSVAIFTDTFENQRNHETLGLLAWGDAIERRKAARTFDERHRDDDEP